MSLFKGCDGYPGIALTKLTEMVFRNSFCPLQKSMHESFQCTGAFFRQCAPMKDGAIYASSKYFILREQALHP